MKLVYLIRPFALTVSLLAFAFAGAQQVSYKVLEDDPSDVKPFSLSLDPLYVDLFPKNMTGGFSVRADLMFLKRLELRADYRMGQYFDLVGMDGESPIMPKNGLGKQLYMEAGASLFFTDKEVTVDSKVVLSSSSFGGYTFTRFIMVPATKRKRWGIRGGLGYNRVAVELQKDQQGYMEKVHEETKARDTLVNGVKSMYNLQTVYFGLHWQSIMNLLVDTDYGKRRNSTVYNFYMDVLFAPVARLGTVSDANGNVYKIETQGSHIKRFGWSIGMSQRRPTKVGLTYKMEFGSRPGYQNKEGYGLNFENAFLLYTIGFNIPMGKSQGK